MAKSLRSKRKRKVRAEKRIVNAKKELVKLKEVAARLHGNTTGGHNKSLTQESLTKADLPDTQVVDSRMLVEGDNDDSMTNSDYGGSVGGKQRGQLKINNQWMNQRKIKSIKNKIKRHNKKKTRRGGGSAGLSSRKAKKSIGKRR